MALAIPLVQGEIVTGAVVYLAVLLYLGPVGVAALLFVVLPTSSILVMTDGILFGFQFAVAMVVAIVNVVLVRLWMAQPALTGESATKKSRRHGWDQLLGGSAFVLAGCGFVVLCVVAGFARAIAHGVDFPVPDAEADTTVLLLNFTWWPGLIVANAGLALWIIQAKRSRPILPWAVADLAIMITLIAIVSVATA
jgi:hypothetical protein